MSRFRNAMLAGLLGFALLPGSGYAADVAPVDNKPVDATTADKPAGDTIEKPAVVDPAVPALIDQLGDADPAVREAASNKLMDLGKAALPALRQAAGSDNPEIQMRVHTLIRKAERRLPPAAPARDGNGHRNSVRVSMTDGQKTVDVDDNGYKIKIRQGTEGIVMDVTGVEDGKPVTETYKAKDADDLKKQNPEAFALYEKYNNGGPGVGFVAIGGGGVGGQIIVQGGNADVVIRQGEIKARMAEAQIAAMERMLEQLQANPDIPEEHRARILEQINRLRARQADVQQKIEKDMEDRRAKALDDLKVPLRDEPKKEEPKKEEPKKDEKAPEEKK
jgi:hypothetical protein